MFGNVKTPPLVPIKYPSGRWGFVGRVPMSLAWEYINTPGTGLCDADSQTIATANNPAMFAKMNGIRHRTFDSESDARRAAESAGYTCTQ